MFIITFFVVLGVLVLTSFGLWIYYDLKYTKEKDSSDTDYGKKRHYESFAGGFAFVTIVLFVILMISAPATLISQHQSNKIYLPEKYRSTVDAIEESKTLLAEGEVSLGEGVEGNQLKKKLSDLIEKKYEVEKEVRFRRRNPWVAVKPPPLEEIKELG